MTVRTMLHHPDLEWYLCRRDAACGVSSTFGAFVAAVERGASSRSPAPPEPYHDGQVGMGPVALRAFARDRLMRSRWARLPSPHQRVLRAWYGARAPSDPQAADPPRLPSRAPGLLGQLGPFARVALLLSPPANVLAACQRGSASAFRSHATRAVAAAHQAYSSLIAAESFAWLDS